MKKLVTSFLFVLAGLFAVDRLGGMAMWWVNQHTHDVTGPKIRYLVNDVNEDVLMMGTSRCNLHYVPSIIRDTLGLSVYNGGIDASDNIYAHYLMLCHVLSKHKPKVICLELRTNDYAVSAAPFRTVSFFAPYFGINEEADSVFRLAGTYWRYKISHLYRYNAKAVSNIAGLFMVAANKRRVKKNTFYCAEFVRYVLKRSKINTKVLPKIIKPQDFSKLEGLSLVYEGKLRDYRNFLNGEELQGIVKQKVTIE